MKLASFLRTLGSVCVFVFLTLQTVQADEIDDALFEVFGCETGYTYDYTVVSPNGMYFGGYQFDLGTWRHVGGQGYPHEASFEEQHYRARLLFLERGRTPWPHC